MSDNKKRLDEINQIMRELNKERGEIINSEKSEKIKEVKSIISEYGITASDLGFRKSGSTKKSEPKYQHPDDPSLTWSGGAGRKPNWVKEWESEGKDIELCRINN